jgi:probable phosphoglycerate mutase
VTLPRLILVRHGETDSNVGRILDSMLPGPPLNATGRAQAEDVAAKLAGEPIIAVYASRATRAQQTAAPIAAQHGLSVQVVANVQEISCGDLEGRSDHEARRMFEEVYRGWIAGHPAMHVPGGESAIELQQRFVPAVGELWRRHAGSPEADSVDGAAIVLASHGAAIRMGASRLLDDVTVSSNVVNAGRVVLAPTEGAPEPGGWTLEFWEEAAPPPGDVTGGAHDE